MSYLVVLTTVPTQKQAQRLARILLKKRLAACIQISSKIQSFYRWKGKVEKAGEFQLWIKTKSALFKKLEKIILQYHPYEVPEIIGMRLTQGHAPYLQWMEKSFESL